MKKHDDIKKASILGIIGNLFLLIIKAIIGFIYNKTPTMDELSPLRAYIFRNKGTIVNKTAIKSTNS